MPTVISPSTNLSGLQGAASGARGRNPDQSEGRSFGAALDRSRAASTSAQQSAEAPATEPLAGRRTARAGDKKSELSADDVMALIAPMSAPIVPTAAQAKLPAEQAAKGGTAKAVDGLAAGAALPAQPGDASAVADAASKEGTEHDAPKSAAPDLAQNTRAAAKPAADQADDANVPLTVATATTGRASDATQTAAAPVQASAPFIPPTAGVKAPAGEKSASASAADAGGASASADKSAPLSQATAAAVEVAKPDLPSTHAAGASADAVADPTPQPLQALQASAAPAVDRAADSAKAAPTLTVAPEVGSSEWGTAVGHQMIRMSTGGHQVAELNLNPANLGPLKVTLTMGDNQAQAMFVSAHESVRKAVEAALPQLRSTLAEQGINLGQTSVGAETRQPNGGGAFAEQNPQRQQGRPDYPGSNRGDAIATQAAAASPSATPVRRAAAGLDTFA